MQEMILKAQEDYKKAMDKILEMNDEYYELEAKVAGMKARIQQLDIVRGLSSQPLRDAEATIIIENDERFSGVYRRHLEMKNVWRRAWIEFDYAKEVLKNVRAVLNFNTFGGDNIANK